ncbi:MAG: type I-E CRISPR-associated protein Cas7/Cse4/CasC [Chloroflexota bacterium]|nr:type I-E CRISPR-associated protein Cas7/Cse4/CasC [Chloroflexota bacterium]
MTIPNFIQIHALHNYTGTLLNRDDSGLAKTMPYGGVTRTRISSQCLKRHWRTAEGMYSLSNIQPDPVRTKELAEAAVMEQVRQQITGIDEELAKAVVSELNTGLYGEKGNDPNSRQPLLFGRSEVDYLSRKVAGVLKDQCNHNQATAAVKGLFDRKAEGDNFAAFRQSQRMPAGIIGAMFGRMMTSDTDANIDAAVHVAHAFTTHGEEKEIDYFTAMEELSGEPGAAHIGETEINSGIYYVYLCVDVRSLVANTTGRPPEEWLKSDRAIAAETAANLVGLVATVSPGAKKGSTAPYGHAKHMTVETGEHQPRSLSGAYRTPSKPELRDALEKLREELECNDRNYGGSEVRRAMTNVPGENQDNTLTEIVQWVRQTVTEGEAE